MMHYYDKNYNNYEIFVNDNFYQERVWNLYYDEKDDIVYVYWAKIRQLSGIKLL